MDAKWELYEETAVKILNDLKSHFNLDQVNGKQKIKGNLTTWEVDAKGICQNGEGIIIVECKRYKKKGINQDILAGLAFKIKDIGANGGIVVSPIGFQTGAAKIAAAENIIEVKLDPDCTTTDYICKFLDKVFIGAGVIMNQSLGLTVTAEVVRICRKCNERFSVLSDEFICQKCNVR
ncbi:MAG: restriction endonuclease [Crenarchaeota archaeon]|nr:restriction endonuclease [Thermoproteota archaeon]